MQADVRRFEDINYGSGDDVSLILDENKLSSDTTLLDKAAAKITIQDKIVTITDGQVESNVFSIAANGTISFDAVADIDGGEGIGGGRRVGGGERAEGGPGVAVEYCARSVPLAAFS